MYLSFFVRMYYKSSSTSKLASSLTITPQLMVKVEVGAVSRVDDGPNYFIDNGHLVNPPPAGTNIPH
jgi:hypothetical protein